MNQNWHYIFPKKLLLRAYSTLKHSLSTTKVNYSSKMKISLCVLIAISFPEPTCLLVSTKTRSSGIKLWNNQFPEAKILGLPVSRRMCGLVYMASRDKVDLDTFQLFECFSFCIISIGQLSVRSPLLGACNYPVFMSWRFQRPIYF